MKRIFVEFKEEEILQLVKSLNPENGDLALKLSKALIAKNDSIHIVWGVEDVIDRAKERGIDITHEQAVRVLDLMERYHDCNYGISWESMDVHIDSEVNEE